MAGSVRSGGGASKLVNFEANSLAVKITLKLPRRQLTLIGITVCLNVLLWSSIIVMVTSLYLIASEPDDTTDIPTEVLTLASSLMSISYIVLHTIFSLKQRIWKHQRRHPSMLKKTSYFAVRFAVTLCVFWLLTCGWDLIIVARRPVCLPVKTPDLEGWEAGTTCVVARIGVAISLIALTASCTLFGMLAVVSRPFEAHVFKHGYRPPTSPLSSAARRPSPTRSASDRSEKYHGRVSTSRISVSTRHSVVSYSNTDVETLDLGGSSPPSTIHAPSPIRAIGLGIFTCQEQPPPLPAAYIPSRTSSLSNSPPIFQPSASYHHLPPPPRMSALVAPSGFVPLSIPTQFSASTWRAVHPTLPSPLGGSATRSNPHLSHTASNFSFYRNRHSRSSVSLTRPRRLSTATPAGSVAWSSRSESVGPSDEGRGSPASGSTSIANRATANDIAYAILNGTPIPGAAVSPPHKPTRGHVRHASAPDSTCGAEDPTRMAKGWKPQLKDSDDATRSGRSTKLNRSSSAEMLSKFSPDSSPDDATINLRKELERELESFGSITKNFSFRRSRSESPLRSSDVPGGAANVGRVAALNRLNQDPIRIRSAWFVEGEPERDHGARRFTYNDVKNKPLPKIAAL